MGVMVYIMSPYMGNAGFISSTVPIISTRHRTPSGGRLAAASVHELGKQSTPPTKLPEGNIRIP